MTQPSLESTIPANVSAQIRDLKVRQVGFGAGPSFMIGAKKDYDPPVVLSKGLKWIEAVRDRMKRAHVYLDDGTTLWFTSSGFEKYDTEKKDQAPKRTSSIVTTDGPVDISVEVDVMKP
jgi:hypothetical protein